MHTCIKWIQGRTWKLPPVAALHGRAHPDRTDQKLTL